MKRITRREALGGLLSTALGLVALTSLGKRFRPSAEPRTASAAGRITVHPPKGSVKRHG